MRGKSGIDKAVYGNKIDWYCFPPVDPKTGEVSALNNAILMGEMRHCDLPARHKREDCTDTMNTHYWIDNGTRPGVVLCPKGLFIPYV